VAEVEVLVVGASHRTVDSSYGVGIINYYKSMLDQSQFVALQVML
jgi:hypothetical protein